MSLNSDLEKLYPNTRVYGPYTSNQDGRQRVVFRETRDDGTVIKGGKSFSMSHGRAILTVNEGRVLHTRETADHVDENKTNDTPGNIQNLTLHENIKKHVLEKKGFIRKETPQYCERCGEPIFSSKIRRFCGGSCRSQSMHDKKREEGNPIVPPIFRGKVV